MNQRLALAGCTALLLVLAGCGQPGNKAPTPAATNAGFEAFVKAAARKSAAELTPEELTEAVNQYVGMQVAAEAAVKTGLDKDPDVGAQLDLTRANVLSETLLARYLKANPVTDGEIQAEYDAQVAATPPEYHARHILVDDKSLAEAIIQKLEAKGDFAALAKQYSKDSSAQNGGDLGWFSPQAMVKEFADAVVALEKGKFTTAPVQTQYGWHVIQLDDTRAVQLPPLDQVKDRVEQLVQRKRVAAHLQELRKESKLDVEKLSAALTEYAKTPKEKAPDAPAATPAEAPGAN
ncbi:MAG: peptidylprolyl isomerase [Chromatiales bacterium]|nr:peptidylprolyl isomerase [Chromatiales bacterium]